MALTEYVYLFIFFFALYTVYATSGDFCLVAWLPPPLSAVTVGISQLLFKNKREYAISLSNAGESIREHSHAA